MTLREVLHAHVPMLRPDSRVRDAVDKMDIYQFPALVILDAKDLPLAVITEGDIVRAAREHGGITKIADVEAVKFATADPTTGSPDWEVSDALQTMMMSGLTLLPIVEDASFRGVVLRVDLMQAMLLP